MKLVIVLAAAAAGLVAARPSPPVLSNNAIVCLGSAIRDAGCWFTDIPCICKEKLMDIRSRAELCLMEKHCTQEDKNGTLLSIQSFCLE
ncbi:mediator of RNA polymerase II transcription subunit 31 [Cordyceps militaris]|uniref:Mediator of RNA polymerase II transcription subunit 31 n=1 Tax=Cordyceps militaris TaxID=73501 RepID=A0A2H4SA75_CORMI|nr:mediator of RNA polymerase II transcription subunit 31 [Cordyceps militaris]